MTNSKLLQSAQKRLKISSETPLLEAEVLLSFAQNISREKLLSSLGEFCQKTYQKSFYRLLTKRQKHIPLAYLTGRKEFYNLEFKVSKYVLIPRPETEFIIEKVLTKFKKNKAYSILDVGTGSGCIAIALAKHLPKSRITAIDISEKALNVAFYNAKKHNVEKRVHFKKSNLLKNIEKKHFDLVIANLPYLPNTSYTKELKYEPQIALKGGGKHGLDIYDKFLIELKNFEIKHMLMEIGHNQKALIKSFLKKEFPSLKLVAVYKDLAGFDRVIEVIL